MKGKIVLAGATGYLGSYIAKELKEQKFDFVAIGRNPEKLKSLGLKKEQMMQLEVTDPATFPAMDTPLDTVISTVGITRQKDGLTYMDVDFQANANLLDFAQKQGARKFIYVSVLHGDQMKNVQITEAKERFVALLKASGMEYCIVRPNGFFSDMKDFLDMASSGRVYLFGDGEFKLNPIHGLDLARLILEMIDSHQTEIEVGGPDILTQNEIGELALKAQNKELKITHLPDWIRRFAIGALKTFTSARWYGPYEFFLTMMAQDNIAPRYGVKRLETYFREEVDKTQL